MVYERAVSLLINGAIENKHGVITYDDLRLDARMTIVPDQDPADIFELIIRPFQRVLTDKTLLKLLELKKSDAQRTLSAAFLSPLNGLNAIPEQWLVSGGNAVTGAIGPSALGARLNCASERGVVFWRHI